MEDSPFGRVVSFQFDGTFVREKETRQDDSLEKLELPVAQKSKKKKNVVDKTRLFLNARMR